METRIVFAKKEDVGDIVRFVKALAIFEKLENEVEVTEEKLLATLFAEKKFAEVIFLEENKTKVGFALFFHNYSTFLGKPGIYLEDLFVLPEARGKGYGKRLLSFLGKLAIERNCGRLEWWVLNWNQEAIDFYFSLGAKSMSERTPQRVTGDALKNLAGISRDSL